MALGRTQFAFHRMWLEVLLQAYLQLVGFFVVHELSVYLEVSPGRDLKAREISCRLLLRCPLRHFTLRCLCPFVAE